MSTLTIIRRDDGQSLVFDNSLSEQWAPTAEVTAHKLEDGVDFTDHVQMNQLVVSLQAVITTTPGAGKGISGQRRVDQATEFIYGCFGKILTLGFAREKYLSNMLLKGMPYIVSNDEGRIFDLTFVQAEVAVGQKILLGKKAAPGVASQVEELSDGGVNSTLTVPAAKQSLISSVLSYVLLGK